MKLGKGKNNLPEILSVLLEVVYWFTIVGVGIFLLFITLNYISGNTDLGNMLVLAQQVFPVRLYSSDIGKLLIDSSLYEVSLFKAEGILLVRNAPLGLVVLNMVLYLLNTSVLLYVVNLLRKILKNITDGKYFDIKNGILIRNIGIVVIIGSIIKALVNISITAYFSANTTFENLEIASYSGSESILSLIFLGFVILVISQIFKHGTEIKKEQDLTI